MEEKMVQEKVLIREVEAGTGQAPAGIQAGGNKMNPTQKINKKLDSKAAVDLSRNFVRKYKESKPKLPRILKTK